MTEDKLVRLPDDAKAYHAEGCRGLLGYTNPRLNRWNEPYALCLLCGGVKQ